MADLEVGGSIAVKTKKPVAGVADWEERLLIRKAPGDRWVVVDVALQLVVIHPEKDFASYIKVPSDRKKPRSIETEDYVKIHAGDKPPHNFFTAEELADFKKRAKVLVKKLEDKEAAAAATAANASGSGGPLISGNQRLVGKTDGSQVGPKMIWLIKSKFGEHFSYEVGDRYSGAVADVVVVANKALVQEDGATLLLQRV